MDAVLARIKQDKLEARAVKCVLIGYPKGIKNYKLWCTEIGNQRVLSAGMLSSKKKKFHI